MDAALDRLLKLEGRLARVESDVQSSGVGSLSSSDKLGEQSLVEYQKQMLSRLQTIRDALVMGDGDIAFVIKERDALKDENAKLKKEAERLNYRINHLIKNMP